MQQLIEQHIAQASTQRTAPMITEMVGQEQHEYKPAAASAEPVAPPASPAVVLAAALASSSPRPASIRTRSSLSRPALRQLLADLTAQDADFRGRASHHHGLAWTPRSCSTACGSVRTDRRSETREVPREQRTRACGWDRSADHIGASHNGFIQRPDTWLHPNHSRKRGGRSLYMALRGRVHGEFVNHKKNGGTGSFVSRHRATVELDDSPAHAANRSSCAATGSWW
jgi:hypothetical protein